MAKHKLAEISIRPSKNGGHAVRHEYQPQARLSRGSLSGGMGMDHVPPEEHTFGPGDHQKLLKHITAALSLRGIEQGKPGQAPEEE